MFAQIRSLQRKGEIGFNKALRRSAVECATGEMIPVERLLFHQREHGIGKLNLAAGPTLLLGEEIEDCRLKDITSIDILLKVSITGIFIPNM